MKPRKPKNHLAALQSLAEAFQPNGPMDFDILDMEAQKMRAAGIPPELLLGFDRTDFGHPIPGGGHAA